MDLKTPDSVISIIIPVYNTEKYLRQCLDSVAGQTYANLQIICVDDGSSDSSRSILERYAARDGRIKILSQPNRGQGAARNRGIEEASGDYIIFVDSDDWCDRELCERLLLKIRADRSDFVICAATVYDEQKEKYSQSDSYHSLREWPGENRLTRAEVGGRLFTIPVMPWGKIYDAAFLKNSGIRFHGYKAFEDNVFFIELFFAMKKFSVCKEFLMFYRINRKNSIMQGKGTAYLALIPLMRHIKEILEKQGVYAEYENAYLRYMLSALGYRQGQIDGRSRNAFYSGARELVLSLEISEEILQKESYIREKLDTYKTFRTYGEQRCEERKTKIPFLKKEREPERILYYFGKLRVFEIRNNGVKKIFGVPLYRPSAQKEK